jgi:hypothetical protein
MKRTRLLCIALLLVGLWATGAAAQVASGGTYTLDQAVVANGGGTSSDTVNNLYTIEGTAGQSAAGYNMGNGRYGINSGFWTVVLAPTATNATITGRVMSVNGLGVRNVTVTLSGGSLTSPRTVLTSGFGYFTFDQIEPGQIYVVSVTSKRYGFANPTQTISVFGDVADIVFQASWQN